MQQLQRWQKLCSILTIALSQPIIQAKQSALQRIKLRAVNKQIKKIQKIDFQSLRKTYTDPNSYTSISDIKPLQNLYSSVKVYDQEENGSGGLRVDRFQTRREIIKQVLEHQMQGVKLEQWMVSRKSKVPIIQQYPVCEYSKKQIKNYSQQALQSIRIHRFEDLVEKILKKQSMLSLSRPQNTMKYKQDSISDSLTNLPDLSIEIAIDMFDWLLQAAAEKDIAMPAVYYVWKFVNACVGGDDSIRDQAYLQVIKQASSYKKVYFQILACMAATVQPSSRMYLPLLNFLYFSSLQPENSPHIPHLSFTFFSLIKNFSNPRKFPPSIPQLLCYMNIRKMPLLIRFPRQNIFFMEWYSTTQEILEELVLLYGLHARTRYLLNFQGVLLENGGILDGFNCARAADQSPQVFQRFMCFQGWRAFVVIKNMLQMYDCQQNFLIMYNYLINQYRSSMFAISNRSCFEIGGLIIASEVEIEENYEFSLAKCLPRSKYQNGLSKSKIKKAQNLIMLEYDKFKGTKTEARKKIIEKLSKSKSFLTHFFVCNVSIDQQEYFSGWVGIKTESIIITEQSSSRIVLHIKYENIKKWGKSSTQLCLKVKQIGDLHIQSQTIQTLISIFTCYLNYLSTQLKTGKLGQSWVPKQQPKNDSQIDMSMLDKTSDKDYMSRMSQEEVSRDRKSGNLEQGDLSNNISVGS